MGERLLYLQRTHDAAPAVTVPDRNRTERRFFEVPPNPLVEVAPAVSDYEEQAIVDWVMAWMHRKLVLAALRMPPIAWHATALRFMDFEGHLESA
jgi:hypothetical protein